MEAFKITISENEQGRQAVTAVVEDDSVAIRSLTSLLVADTAGKGDAKTLKIVYCSFVSMLGNIERGTSRRVIWQLLMDIRKLRRAIRRGDDRIVNLSGNGQKEE